MSMRIKIITILVFLAAVTTLVYHGICRATILPRFVTLEREEAESDLQRVQQALNREVEQLTQVTMDYAEWDESAAFIESPSPDYIRANLAPQTFVSLKVNFVHFYAKDGTLVWGESRDAESGEPLRIAGLPARGFPPDDLLLRPRSTGQSVSGLVALGEQLAIVASCPVRGSSATGPVHGTVLFGRIFSATDENRLRNLVEVDLSLLKPAAAPGPQASQPGEEWGVAFDESQPGWLRASAPLRDVNGATVRTLQIELCRRITAKGEQVVREAERTIVLASLVLLVGAYWSFGRFVVRPIQQLVEHVQWVRQSGDLAKTLGNQQPDEVGTLAREFDFLLAQLARSRATRLRFEGRLKAVLDDQTELIRRFLPDGTTTFVNRAYARYCGKSEEGLVGRGAELSVPEEDRPLIEAHLHSLDRQTQAAEVEHRVILPSGEVRWVRWTTRAICDAQGQLTEFQSVGRDVTEQLAPAAGCGAEEA